MNAFLVELPNKMGELARVTEAIAAKGVNITGVSGTTCGTGGSVAILTADDATTRAALKDAKFSFREVEATQTPIGNVPGALAKVTRRLADAQCPGADLLEAGDHPQAGRLAAARWSDEDHEFAVTDLQVEVFHGLEIAVHLLDVVERHRCHGATSTPSCPSRAHASSRRGGVDGLRTRAARGQRIVGVAQPERKGG